MDSKDLLKLHDTTCIECKAIMVSKNSDYTGGKNSKDPFANFKCSLVLGVHPVKGLLMRMLDKIQRVNSFCNDDELQVPGESVDDAFNDLVNYAILGKAILQEEREAKTIDTKDISYPI